MGRALILALAVLLLNACSNTGNKKAIDDIERRHSEDLQRMG